MTGEGQELHHHLRLRRTEVLTVRGAGTPAVLKGQVQLGHLFAPTKRELQFAGDPVLLPKSRIQSQVDGGQTTLYQMHQGDRGHQPMHGVDHH